MNNIRSASGSIVNRVVDLESARHREPASNTWRYTQDARDYHCWWRNDVKYVDKSEVQKEDKVILRT